MQRMPPSLNAVSGREGNAMTENHDRLAPRRDELQLLLEDLACVCGTLSEIMTAWRRARPSRPELRPDRLVRLQDDARQLAADLNTAAEEGWALRAAGRLAALEEEAAAIRAVTSGSGCPEAGDRGLWELLVAAVRRAQARHPTLPPVPVTVPGSGAAFSRTFFSVPDGAGTRSAIAVSCDESGQVPPGGG
jgi:hypothetical protein